MVYLYHPESECLFTAPELTDRLYEMDVVQLSEDEYYEILLKQILERSEDD